MFKGNVAYEDTYVKESDTPKKPLSERTKREVRTWTDELNRKRFVRNITVLGVIIFLTALIVYSILDGGTLDFWLNKLP